MQFLLFRWSLAYITTEMVVRAGRLAGRCRCNYHNVVEEGVAPRWYGNDVVQNETVTRALRTTLDNHAKSLFMLCYLHDLPYRSCYLIFHARVISPSIIIFGKYRLSVLFNYSGCHISSLNLREYYSDVAYLLINFQNDDDEGLEVRYWNKQEPKRSINSKNLNSC